jgi:hypothetical protein
LDSASSNAAGAISEKPMATNRDIADARRTVLCYSGHASLGKKFVGALGAPWRSRRSTLRPKSLRNLSALARVCF